VTAPLTLPFTPRPVPPNFGGGGGGDTTQDYWYCWDEGDPMPHHLGYHVSGDHLCDDSELSDAGCTDNADGTWDC
jgi:hypothetical protein